MSLQRFDNSSGILTVKNFLGIINKDAYTS